MNAKLNRVQNWPELARAAKWSASALARDCGVSLRTLERHFLKEMGKSPKAWLLERRHQEAEKLLKTGLSVKETAGNVGYQHFNNFSRDYKKHTGCYPTEKTAPLRRQNPTP